MPSTPGPADRESADASGSRGSRWFAPRLPEGGWVVRVRWLVLRLLGYYLLIVAGVAFFQRSLIYVPRRVERIEVTHAKLLPGRVHDVMLTTDDNLELRGWHFVQQDSDASSSPSLEQPAGDWAVLFFHGNGGDRTSRVFDCLSFVRLGAEVYHFDYRGYGDNPGDPCETTFVSDARRMWDFVTLKRGIAPERIVLYGESLGGALATRLACEKCREGTPPAGTILFGTFSSLEDVGARRYPWLPVRWVLLDRYRSIDEIADLSCPLLQFHGRQDEIVPFELGRRLFERAPRQSESGLGKQFIELSRGGHNDISVQDFQQPVAEFLARIADSQSERTTHARDFQRKTDLVTP